MRRTDTANTATSRTSSSMEENNTPFCNSSRTAVDLTPSNDRHIEIDLEVTVPPEEAVRPSKADNEIVMSSSAFRPYDDKGHDDNNNIGTSNSNNMMYTALPSKTKLEDLGTSAQDDEMLLKHNVEQPLREDIYSLMTTSRVCSGGFCFAFSIFSIQMGILALALADLVDMSGNPITRNNVENRLNEPADTELQVTIAQFFGTILIINFAVAEGDFLKGLTLLVDGFDPDLMKYAPHAKKVKWYFAGCCQTLVGTFMVMDAFILMIQSETVIDMCLDFAALSFVQDFDDAAFQVGAMGLLNRRIQADCIKMGHLVVKSENRERTRHVRQAVVVLLSICLFICYFVVTSWKWSGYFMCESLYVQFGDAYGPEWPYYSGHFHSVGKNLPDRRAGRIVYIEPTGTLQVAFCEAIPAWTVSNRTAVGEDFCDYMIRSSETNTFDVVDVASESWFASTAAVGDVPMDWMAVVCADCNEDLCNPKVGQCVKNQCKCNDGFLGLNCELQVPDCKFLGLDMRSKSGLQASPVASLFMENEFIKLEDDAGLADQFYFRPIYASFNKMTGKVDTIIVFTGRRWIIMGTPQEKQADVDWNVLVDNMVANDVKNQPLKNLLNTTRTFSTLRPFFFSNPVDYGTATHAVDPIQTQWVLAVRDDSLPLIGYRGDDTFQVTAQFICSHCNDTTSPCMNGGTCNTTSTYCDCPVSYGGFRCEYSYSCQEHDCLNGGTCDKVFSICRDCDALYYGNLCQFKRAVVEEDGTIDYSAQAALLGDDFFVCRNGTTCNNGGWCTTNVTACSCLPAFSGDRCEFLVDNSTLLLELEDGFNCTDTTCINGGWCEENSTSCGCPEPYRGTFCEEVFFGNNTEADDFFICFNETCLNGGFCGEVTDPCICPDDFSGDFYPLQKRLQALLKRTQQTQQTTAIGSFSANSLKQYTHVNLRPYPWRLDRPPMNRESENRSEEQSSHYGSEAGRERNISYYIVDKHLDGGLATAISLGRRVPTKLLITAIPA
ncbi:WNT inhibitory factor 1 [Seminavis robusta]|uniref:WNT inhibitory factor 1 n=1 Tax=Seminavis robusta TaxID=568900 RepID=A0A9N8EK26_9STRA|nr:WNT inhibitory factor 1 [Seminavis robusta]|eukprot:Sro1127_g244230.1 WNT inhibitory factor 1 (1003) ;mRNA; r:27115-31107